MSTGLFVYLIQAGAKGPVKIGSATKVTGSGRLAPWSHIKAPTGVEPVEGSGSVRSPARNEPASWSPVDHAVSSGFVNRQRVVTAVDACPRGDAVETIEFSRRAA